MPGEYPAQLRALGMRASVAAPVLVDGRHWGAVAAGSGGGPFTADSEARLGAFAELVAQAIANVDARLKLSASRARIVEAADDARRRIERDLHDGAQQQLVSLALDLRMLKARLGDSGLSGTVDEIGEKLATALAELREFARGIHPAFLSERGVQAAVEALVARAPLDVDANVELPERLPAPVE